MSLQEQFGEIDIYVFDQLLKGRIQRSDRIIVLDQGSIIQSGTNEGLLQEGWAYKRLHDLQFNL